MCDTNETMTETDDNDEDRETWNVKGTRAGSAGSVLGFCFEKFGIFFSDQTLRFC